MGLIMNNQKEELKEAYEGLKVKHRRLEAKHEELKKYYEKLEQQYEFMYNKSNQETDKVFQLKKQLANLNRIRL